MPFFYGMLAVAGWIWLVIVLMYLFLRLRRDRRPTGQSDVEVAPGSHEKQP